MISSEEKKSPCAFKGEILSFEELNSHPGIQRVTIDLRKIYTGKQREQALMGFKDRFDQFKNDNCNYEVLCRKGDTLVYLTECIIPTKRKKGKDISLLLLLGNPASHSVSAGMFFSYEGKLRRDGTGTDHRFWKTLRKVGILKFKYDESYAKDVARRSRSRKKELYDLDYTSDFRVGFTAFYSMPSAASGSKWAGVEGLRRLFGNAALQQIAVEEKKRIGQIVDSFLSCKGGIFAFQKCAYEEVEDQLRNSNGNIRIWRVPATRWIRGVQKIKLLQEFKECLLNRL